MNKENVVSPIAIDMGAKYTGVYYANYAEGATIDKIEKNGQVLTYNNYTALMVERTAKRHVRRGYQRKKLAKRLLSVILKEYFDFPAKNHSQAIGFLLNRRGFSFLQEEYSKEHLENFPEDAWKELTKTAQTMLERCDKVAFNVAKFTAEAPEKIAEIQEELFKSKKLVAFRKKEKGIKNDFVYLNYIKKIKDTCQNILDNQIIIQTPEKKDDKYKLSETSNWIIERINQDNDLKLRIQEDSYQTNLLNQLNKTNSKKILKSLPGIEQLLEEKKVEQALNNKSIWNFNFEDFKFNDTNEKGLEEKNARIHLHHFCYAISKINNELSSGSRHRSKYFDEINGDLDNFFKDVYLKNEHSPTYIKNFVNEVKKNTNLNKEKIYKLVCHISNFELKPLRAYFNDSTPIKKGGKDKIFHSAKNGGDKFSNEKLSRLSSTWFLKHWIVSAQKDNQKKVDDYDKLKNLWESHKNKQDIIEFWINTEPFLTIPPYQAMFNRRPPKCYSLLLNEAYLHGHHGHYGHYPKWKEWLKLLKPDVNYKNKLEALESQKAKYRKQIRKEPREKETQKKFVSKTQIMLRQMQFILDAAKDHDPYKLNEIWSIYHRLQKLEGETKDIEKKLETAKKESKLPEELKEDLNFEMQGTFGHFLNKYYQTRRQARDGRYFLIQEKKDRWLTENKLLVLCTHKPRQKKHQWQLDLIAILGIDEEELSHLLKDTDIVVLLKKIKGFPKACGDAAKAQKDHRGYLKIKINHEIAGGKGELFKLDKSCKEKAKSLATILWPDLEDAQIEKKSERFNSIFSFAQINNIIYKERSGFSKTCPVCSTDNAIRMQETNDYANASRLIGMSVRIIDGVVMRICDAISRKIATTKWQKIKSTLEEGRKVRIPLILEQNQFEFEPSLKGIKGRKKEGAINNNESEFIKKEDRIKKASKGISAFSGKKLGDWEIDHIIPRSSKYGTLNDEANLIYLLGYDNKNKGKDFKYLKDLDSKYKKKIFSNLKDTSDEKIKEFIYTELEGEDPQVGSDLIGDRFCFGKYLSFINLSENQKIAFRHALFLDKADPLRQKVINVLQNRNRAIVNGTQRYLAQCIIDKLHRIAREEKKEHLIEFDYFEYNSMANQENSIYDLRKFYEKHEAKITESIKLSEIAKSKNAKQKLMSHCVDAQMAFLLAVQNHQNDGSMGLKLDDNDNIHEEIIKETGEIVESAKYFDLTNISEDNYEEVELNRKKSELGVRFHRPFHRPNFYAQNYVPIFLGRELDKEIEIRVGFSWDNSSVISTKKYEQSILDILGFADNSFLSTNSFKSLKELHNCFDKKTKTKNLEFLYIHWNKSKIHEYFVSNFSNNDMSKGKTWDSRVDFLINLSYRIQKEKIAAPATIYEVINGLSDKKKPKNYFTIKTIGKEIEIPAKLEWLKLSESWRAQESEKDFKVFLSEYFDNEKQNKHQKVRKIYSLPIVNSLGNFLQKRTSWNENKIFQISPDSDSRLDGNKFSRLILLKNGELKLAINKPFNSKNTFKLKPESLYSEKDYVNIDPSKWYRVKNEKDFPNGIEKIEYCIDNTTRPKVKIKLSSDFNIKSIGRVSLKNASNKGSETKDFSKILENPLTNAKENKSLKEKLEVAFPLSSIEYTASGFTEEIKKKLLESM